VFSSSSETFGTTVAMPEPSGMIQQVFRMANRTFRNGGIDVYSKHMPAIKAAENVVPEMNITPVNGQQLTGKNELCNFFAGFFNQPAESGT
jgi:hypothetical protein